MQEHERMCTYGEAQKRTQGSLPNYLGIGTHTELKPIVSFRLVGQRILVSSNAGVIGMGSHEQIAFNSS